VIVSVLPDGVFYVVKNESDVRRIFEEHVLKGRRVLDLEISESQIRRTVEVERVAEETRIVLKNVGEIDPT
ncbi:MAG TPA: NADP oxidoreductase, partial [Thermotoga naphthophila]|nr:NADP oxidoreductase [Thermotoga petrophila]